MEEIVHTLIAAILYVLHSVKSLLAEVLACKMQNAHSKGMWGAVCLILFAKVGHHHPSVAKC